ncbi:MAG: DUF805 domain-containing protein [Candidatus Competibacteraceae bacterium]|nr:MAG: DUF805 domain-containing protein [Candidatus Competibacteraceae bacterium]
MTRNQIMTSRANDPSPYQPPRGAIAPVAPDRYGEIKLLSVRGRLGRLRYLGYSVALGLLVNLVAGLLGGMAVVFLSGDPGEWLAVGVFVALAALAVLISMVLGIQRLHDFDASGWWSLLMVAPLANLILYLVLLIMPGTPGANRFGDPTPPNTLGVILLALLPPVLLLIAVAIVIAIPVYLQHSGVQ